jgi:hypothetical protein
MKILLQDTKTGLCRSQGGCWNDNPDGALAFLNEVRPKDFSITTFPMPRWSYGLNPAPQRNDNNGDRRQDKPKYRTYHEC